MSGKNKFILGFVFLVAILLVASLSSAYTRSSPQLTNPGAGGIFSSGSVPSPDRDICQKGQDFILNIAPQGCSPKVVRSDLLEEQNQPVFCPITATKINPLIQVKAIDWISVQDSELSEHVASVGYHPNRGALQGFTPGFQGEEMEQPQFLNKVGYIVVNLQRTPVEDNMPDFVSGNLTARISYDVDNAFGLRDSQVRLGTMNDDEWQEEFTRGRFFDGRGFLRVEGVRDDRATVSVYSGNTRVSGESEFRQRVTSTTLREGETSDKIFLPSVDMCLGSMTLDMRDIENPGETARLDVNGREIQVRRNEDFLNGQCTLESLERLGMKQTARVSCTEDLRGVSGERQFGGSEKTLTLGIDPSVNLTIEGKGSGSYTTGEKLYDFEKGSDRSVFLGYVGQKGVNKTPFILPVVSTADNREEFLESYFGEQSINTYGSYIESDSYKRAGSWVTESMIGALNQITSASVGIEVAEPIFIGKDNAKEPQFLFEALREGGYSYLDDPTKILSAFPGLSSEEPPKNNELYTKKNITFNSITGGSNMDLRSDIRRNYEKAMQDFDSLKNDFSSIKEREASRPYGMRSLARQIDLAKNTNQMGTVKNLCEDLEETYPEDANTTGLDSYFDICNDKIKLANSDRASGSFYIDEQNRDVSFEGIRIPSFEEYGVKLRISNADEGYNGVYRLSQRGRVYLSNDEYIKLSSQGLSENSARLDVLVNESGVFNVGPRNEDQYEIELDETRRVGNENYQIKVEDINLEKVAVVGINAQQNFQSSTANLSFEVGIEKRNIQLTPNQTMNRIEDVNASIETWKKASNALGKTVEGFKKACFATGTVLTAKNFFENAFGEGTGGLARKRVMDGSGGWEEKCTRMVNQQGSEYEDVQECYLDNADKIDSDVENLKDQMNKQDQDIKSIQEKYKLQDNTLSSDVVNTSGVKKEYSERLAEKIRNNRNLIVKANDTAEGDESLNITLLINSFENGYNRNIYTLDKLKEIDLYFRAAKEDPNTMNLKRLYGGLRDVQENALTFGTSSTGDGYETQTVSTEDTITLPYKGLTVSDIDVLGSKFSNPDIALAKVAIKSKPHYIILNKSVNQEKIPPARDSVNQIKVYDLNGNRDISQEILSKYDGLLFRSYSEGTYNNRYIGSSTGEEVVVRYYDSSSLKGMPAVVPFSETMGWYAYMKKDLSARGSSTRSYDESGRLNSFRLCNVGEDGIENAFSRTSDDICQVVNLRSQGTYNNFNGLTPTQTKNLVIAATKAVEQASRQMQSGNPDEVSINTIESLDGNKQGTWTLPVGQPATGSPGFTCSDFMSPKECNLIFNVCDPVVCPNDRCDFGGKFPVRDVQQSGLVGSALLCAPNFPEVKVPLCLSGIHGGMKNLISVQESYRSCLQESLETGKTVGICDQIRSVYMCDFIWKQAEPLAKEGVKYGTQQLSGGSPARGGAEYRNVDNAISSAEESFQYFTQEYGINSNNAFQSRSTQNIGGRLCKGFLSAPGSKIGTAFDQATQPDSPAQFHGRLNSETYSTKTNPPTSHYKIFYHIYAGDQRGAYYKVYLKRGEGSTYYQDTSNLRQIDGGYVDSGEKVTRTVDRRLPSGYGELCINVNGRQECGFKRASTSFAQNWMSDRYVQDQVENKNIRSEKECISGSASAFNALNSNPQAGAENALDPQIYQSGLTRICAEENPGQSVPNDRWVDVGHCGNPEMRCWLDQRSIEDSIDNEYIQNQTLNETEKTWRDQINTSDEYLTNRKEFWNKLDNILENESSIDALEVGKIREIFENGNLTRLLDRVVYNDMKAEVLFERGKGYAKLAKEMFKKWAEEFREDDGGEQDGEEGGEQGGEEGGEAEGDETPNLPEKKVMCESPKLRYQYSSYEDFAYCFKYFEGGWHWTNKCDKVGTTVEKEFQPEERFEDVKGEKEVKIKWISVQNRSKLKSVEDSRVQTPHETIKQLRGRNYQAGIELLVNNVIESEGIEELSVPKSLWNRVKDWGDSLDSIGSIEKEDASRYFNYYDASRPGAFRDLGNEPEQDSFMVTYDLLETDLTYRVKHDSFSDEKFTEVSSHSILWGEEEEIADDIHSYESGWSWQLFSVSGEVSREDYQKIRELFDPKFETLKNMDYSQGASYLITGQKLPKCFGHVYGECDSPGTITCSSDRKTVLSCEDGKWGPKDTCSYGQYCNPNVEDSYCQNYIGEQQEACFPVDSKVCSNSGDKILQCSAGPVEQLLDNMAIAEASSAYTELKSCGQGKKCNPVSNECVEEQNLPNGWAEFYETGKNPYVSGSRSFPESRDSAESRSINIKVSKNQMSVDELSKILKDTGTTTRSNIGEELVGRTCDCTGSECEDLAEGIISATESSPVQDPLLVLSIIMQESSCEIGENTAGAKGLMQLTKETTLDICEPQMGVGNFGGYYGEAKTKAQNNLDCGTLILSYKKSSTDGNVLYSCKQGDKGYKSENRREEVRYTGWKAALRGYVGTGCGHPYYVEDVMKRYGELRKIAGKNVDRDKGSSQSPFESSVVKIDQNLNKKQLNDASPVLKEFVGCVGKKYKEDADGKLVVTSISDNNLYGSDPKCEFESSRSVKSLVEDEDEDGCQHMVNSCHYYGSQGEISSRAVDFSKLNSQGGDRNDGILNDAYNTCLENNDYGGVDKVDDYEDSEHVHFEVGCGIKA